MTKPAPKTLEERFIILQRELYNQKQFIKAQAETIDKMVTNFQILNSRIDKLRTAVPHVSFKDW